MSRVKGEGEFVRATINLGRNARSIPQGKCLLPVSITGNPHCQNSKLAATVLKSVEVFKEITVLIVDIPQKENLQFDAKYEGLSDTELRDVTLEMGDTFWQENKEALRTILPETPTCFKKGRVVKQSGELGELVVSTIDNPLTTLNPPENIDVNSEIEQFNHELSNQGIPLRVVRWDEWLEEVDLHTDLNALQEQVVGLFENGTSIMQSVQSTAQSFLDRRTQKGDAVSENDRRASEEYLKAESITVFAAGYLNYDYLLYPGKATPMFEALLEHITFNSRCYDDIKPVKWLTPHFRRHPAEKVQPEESYGENLLLHSSLNLFFSQKSGKESSDDDSSLSNSTSSEEEKMMINTIENILNVIKKIAASDYSANAKIEAFNQLSEILNIITSYTNNVPQVNYAVSGVLGIN